MNKTNNVWKKRIESILNNPEYTPSPRGMEVREIINGSYKLQMPAYVNLTERKLNKRFMFREAAWIISGSNRLIDLTETMKRYADFSDDGIFLNGAYGPKVVDQLNYVVNNLIEDNDSRQAVISIWRERPAKSKDIPCTLTLQFLIRENKLHMVVNMRSHDVILGFPYDIFSFSMVGLSVLLLLRARGHQVSPGELSVNAGSMHLYKQHYSDIESWINDDSEDDEITEAVDRVMESETYLDLIAKLMEESNENL